MSTSFESLNLRPELLKACRKQGFREATPIQALVIPVVARGGDVIVEAKTGSGKTLAYGLPLLDREPSQTAFPEILIIPPTRELAQQIEAELKKSAGTLDRRILSVTGRGGMDRQKEQLDAGATIVVGTVGRLEELIERKMIQLSHVRTLVLDEIDELLRGGFSQNLANLLTLLPWEKQTLMFSATVPTEVESLGKRIMRKPERLRLSVERELPAELSHKVLFTSVDNRVANLAGYLKLSRPYQALIFCGTRHETEEVNEAIAELGLEAEFLHGELSANKRKQLIERFRSGDLPVLVASDLAARGLDLPGVDLVVNYSLPQGTAAYLHRAGRTGRAGRPGIVLSLVIEQQHEQFEKLKPTFTFESVEVRRSTVIHREQKTREERDLEYGQRAADERRKQRYSQPKPTPTRPSPPPRENDRKGAPEERRKQKYSQPKPAPTRPSPPARENVRKGAPEGRGAAARPPPRGRSGTKPRRPVGRR